MEFDQEKCTRRSCKKQITEGMPNKERIRTLGEKENYKYLEIFETGPIKQEEMKKILEKIASDKRENFSIPSSETEISLKG